MFFECSSLININISYFNNKNVGDIMYVFWYSSLKIWIYLILILVIWDIYSKNIFIFNILNLFNFNIMFKISCVCSMDVRI